MKVTKSTRQVTEKEITPHWYLLDLNNKILGRVAPKIASVLQGKHKTNYVPHLDMGDYVVVINAKDVMVTGAKENQKEYTYFSGYPGGLKTTSLKELRKKNPEEIIRHAVSGMLPKNKLRDRRLSRLFIYPGNEHSYKNQEFKNLEV